MPVFTHPAGSEYLLIYLNVFMHAHFLGQFYTPSVPFTFKGTTDSAGQEIRQEKVFLTIFKAETSDSV